MNKMFVLLLISFSLFGCVSLTEKAGRALDGSAFAEKRLALYKSTDIELTIAKNKENEQLIIITFEKYPMIKLRCSYPGENGIIFINSLEYLAGNTFGWNEFSLDMIGTGNFNLETAVLEIEEIEFIQISKGRIHRYDTRITGEEALTALRNRHERILALTEWMASINKPQKQPIKDFEKYWKPIFFPELVSKKQRPFGWQNPGDIRLKAESIRWNTGYTERVFPEELWQVRNSGTLLRDWEEALFWIYFKYEWENIIALLGEKITLEKIK